MHLPISFIHQLISFRTVSPNYFSASVKTSALIIYNFLLIRYNSGRYFLERFRIAVLYKRSFSFPDHSATLIPVEPPAGVLVCNADPAVPFPVRPCHAAMLPGPVRLHVGFRTAHDLFRDRDLFPCIQLIHPTSLRYLSIRSPPKRFPPSDQ